MQEIGGQVAAFIVGTKLHRGASIGWMGETSVPTRYRTTPSTGELAVA